MSEVKVNKISPRTNCGTTTLGDSGDSFVIPSGVTITNNGTQTGFGRTGTVDWDTTAKTAAFTAISGNGYFVDTTSAAITVTLPASPSAGDIVAVADYANTADTNNITIARNGSPIEGGTNNHTITAEGGTATLVYVDGTQGWRPINSANSADFPVEPLFTVATGGTITTCGDYKIHTFTGPGNFCVSQVGNAPTTPGGGPDTVSYMVVAGGGGAEGGGAGGGGFREGRDITPSYTASPLVAPAGLTITATCFPVTVGGGGSAGTQNRGSNSVFSTITSTGGGGSTWDGPGQPGGSGGGGSKDNTPGTYPGGSGNTPPVSPPQGNGGGTAFNSGQTSAGGGGAGGSGNPTPGPGNGGGGIATSITGSSVTRAGGGGGGSSGQSSSGGSGGGGPGGNTGTPGTVNTGGGGGGGYNTPRGSGGSGIVVIRYKFQ